MEVIGVDGDSNSSKEIPLKLAHLHCREQGKLHVCNKISIESFLVDISNELKRRVVWQLSVCTRWDKRRIY